MRLLAALVALLLVQSLSAIFLTHDQSGPFRFQDYTISRSTIRGSEGTNVSFVEDTVYFHNNCNHRYNTYVTAGNKFRVAGPWWGTRIICPANYHLLDKAIQNLFSQANTILNTFAPYVDFLQSGRYLFTIRAAFLDKGK